MVALVPEGSSVGAGASAKPTTSELSQITPIYLVHAPTAEVRQPGEIVFANSGTPGPQAGIYRWDDGAGTWLFVGAQHTGNGIAGRFDAFGRYGVFVDVMAPTPGDPVVGGEDGFLAIPVVENGSGVDPGTVNLAVDGEAATATYVDGRVLWRPTEGTHSDVVRLELTIADLAGNTASWERRVDLSHLVPGPSDYALYQNAPNPFNPSTVIRFEVPEATDLRLVIFNMLGQEVRMLLSETVRPGRYSVTWDGEDDGGRPVAGGVYVYRLQTRTAGMVRKMLLLK